MKGRGSSERVPFETKWLREVCLEKSYCRSGQKLRKVKNGSREAVNQRKCSSEKTGLEKKPLRDEAAQKRVGSGKMKLARRLLGKETTPMA